MGIIHPEMTCLNTEEELLKGLRRIYNISKIWDSMQFGYLQYLKTWDKIIMDMLS